MTKLLVTGGAGFIGTNFVYYWMEKHPHDKIVILDALTYAGNKSNLCEAERKTNIKFIHGNILNLDLIVSILREYEIDTIVNFAAESHVDRSIQGPDVFMETNILGTHSMLKAAKKIWLDERNLTPHRFHHISTDEVYGSLLPGEKPFTERTRYAPNSPYAASKASSDHLVRAYHKTYGLNVTISNCSNNYGPYQFMEKLLPLVIANILNNRPIPIYGDGQQIRDWLYVDDHIRGIDLILKKGVPGETYNIGGNNERSNINLVRLICELIHREFKQKPDLSFYFPQCPSAHGRHPEELIEHVTDRPGHDRRYAINPNKIFSQLGFEPRVSLERGLEKTFAFYSSYRMQD